MRGAGARITVRLEGLGHSSGTSRQPAADVSACSAALRRAHESDFARPGGFERRRADQFLLAIAFEGGAEPFRQFANSHEAMITGAVGVRTRSGMMLSYNFMSARPSATIAPTARVHPDAVIGPGVRIGEFCVIESDVAIGAGCVLEPYVYVKRWTTLGERNEISAGTVLGTDPLDKGFTGERSYLQIGNGNKIREHYTISRGTKPESVTEIGDDNYIMTSGHIAHNCKIGDHTVIASCALVAGYVEVEDRAFISGRRGGPSVLEDRAPGDDRRQYPRQ